MAQEENYFKPEDYEHLRKMLGDHGADSLSGLQRTLLGMSEPMEQQQQAFSPHVETYSAIDPMIDEDEVPMKAGWLSKYMPPYMQHMNNAYKRMNEDQKLKALTGSDSSEVERLMMERLMGDED